MSKFLNLAARILFSFVTLSSAKAYDLSNKSFVNPESKVALSVAGETIGRDHYYWDWLTFPRNPAVSDNWIAYVQDFPKVDDPNEPRLFGDIYLIHRQTGKKIKLTESRIANLPDLFEDTISFTEKGEIILAHLDTINFNDLIQIGENLFKPAFVKKIYITEGIIEGCGCSQINRDKVVFKVATEPWPQILYYDIGSGRIQPVSIVPGNKYDPAIDGDWAVYSVHQGQTFYPNGKVKDLGNWNVYAYNFSTAQEVPLDTNLSYYKRSDAVYDDTEIGQAIVAYEKHNWGKPSGIGIKRLKVEGGRIIIDPNENPYNLPKEFIAGVGADLDWLDMHGSIGQGPVVVFGDYSTVRESGVHINGINLRTGVKFNISTGTGWQYSPRVWFDKDGSTIVVYRDDNFLEPQQKRTFSSLSGTTETQTKAALVLNHIIDRPEPNYCGDLGTDYLDADVNRDCRVDFNDFLVLGENWLRNDCYYGNNSCNWADTNKDHQVDSEDFKAVVWNLGKSTDPLDPECSQCQLQIPPTQPNISVITSTGRYWEESDYDYYENDSEIRPIQTEKKIITYVFDDKSFGLLDASKIEIPTSGIEGIFTERDYRDHYFPGLEESIAKNWTFSQTESKVVLESTNPLYNLNAGKKLAFALVYETPGCEEKDVILHTSVGHLVYKLPVPLEKTLEGDLDSDGVVDMHDLGILAKYWLISGHGLNKESGDIFRDGKVDFKDYVKFVNDFGKKEKWK